MEIKIIAFVIIDPNWIKTGLCSSSAPLLHMTNICPWASRKSCFCTENSILGALDFLGLEHGIEKWEMAS